MAIALASSSVLQLQATTGPPPCSFGTGTGRPLTAAGHGVVVLPGGRRAPPRRPLLLLVPSTVVAVKATGGSGGSTEQGGDEEDCELVRQFKAAVQAGKALPAEYGQYTQMPPGYLRDTLGDLAEGSFNLWAKVTNTLKPTPGTKIYQGLYECGDIFAAGEVRKKAISWKHACDLLEGLDLLRRVVSAALHAPLPLNWNSPLDAKLDSELIVEWGVFKTLQRTYRIVLSDINNMLQQNGHSI